MQINTSVVSLFVGEHVKFAENQLYTIGIHPWHSGSAMVGEWLLELAHQLQNTNCIGVGEVGLDKFRGAPIHTQITLLEQQTQIAQQQGKSLIIHCVRAWNELIAVKRKVKTTVPWAIHGFKGKPELAKELVREGFYISFGEILTHPSPAIISSLMEVPLDRLFLETDEEQVSIEEVYAAASHILNIPLTDLESHINSNFAAFFGLSI
ncbi:MAG: TatD family hydrolase [Bacteroidales bacterium]|nr:TatD family hydrolase [Bacteroidales bacterium]MBN2749039.1 TatD family hydrolase [Bacteroidales bacterium]